MTIESSGSKHNILKMAISYAIIGTNWITSSWITAAEKTKQWKLQAVYSRQQFQAEAFGTKHGCTTFYTSLEDLAADTAVQAVYIASPNSLHYIQAKQMLQAKKHVILEKPATSTVEELDALFAIAKAHGVFLIEAYRHIQEANYKLLRKAVVEDQKLGPIYGASFSYASYSSRYDNVLAGEEPNIFSLNFSGGSLVDVGVYPITFAVAMFGLPKKTTYAPFICRTGVDGGGVGILHYENFGVQINHSKGYRSTQPNEIYGEKGTITINGSFDLESIKHFDPKTKASTELAGPAVQYEKPNVNMEEEALEFARIIREADDKALYELEVVSRNVIKVTTDMRSQAGIVYPADRS